MLKIVGSAVVILSATLFGMNKYLAFFDRKKNLADILVGARRINSKLAVLHSPLHEAFMDSSAFFETVSSKILSGQLPEDAVNETATGISSLKSEDLKIIERFSSGLCATSCEEQLANLTVFISELEKSLEEASNELGTKGKLCVKGSILSAAAIVLLLI